MTNSVRDIIRRLAGDMVESRLRADDAHEPAPGPPEKLAKTLAEIGFDESPSTVNSFLDVAIRLCVEGTADDRGFRVDQFTDLAAGCLESPSPGSALTNLHRYLERTGGPSVFLDTLRRAPPLADLLVTTFGASQYMADILIRNPGYVYWLMDGRTWKEPDTDQFYTDRLRGETEVFRSVEGKLNAIRRAHRQALLKIGVRDLLGEAPVEQTTEKLSNLADAITQVVLEVVGNDLGGGNPATGGAPKGDGGFAVIALGKLGGRELNYSSDIDLVYVCSDADEETMAYNVKLARAFTTALTDVTPEGYLCRVDLRLRPDGQAGPLVNTETSMRIYYENRGRPWEFQAMLKARAIAGDRELGHRMLRTVSGLVYNPSLSYSPLEDIARMRAKISENIPAHERSFNIKLMSGGIRDIEFTAQTFQLMHGHRHSELRTPNTLKALGQIRSLGFLQDWEVDNLSAAYRFFRLVEHRLQMMHQMKTHTVPESAEEIELLARRVGKGPLGTYTTESFLEALSKHLSNVRTFSDSFFAGEDVHPHSVLLLLPEDDNRAETIITQYGVEDVRRAMHVLHTMAYGSFPRLHDRATRSTFEELMPYLLEGAAETGDPDRTLVNVAQLAEASRNESGLYRLLTASPPARRRVIAIAGFSSYLTKRLNNQMEYFDNFVGRAEPDLEAFEQVSGWDREGSQGLGDLAGLDDRGAVRHRERHKRWLDRARIAGFIGDHVEGRIGSRSPGILTRSVRGLVEEAFERTVGADQPIALFALGSFAVGEPRVFSDLDVIVVAAEADIPAVTGKVQMVNRWFDDGGLVKLDFRLRGEGASAPLVQDVGFYRQYFEHRMSLWERVAFAKCQFWWGDETVAEEFLEALRSVVARPFTRPEVASLVKSRKSIESLTPKIMPEWETKRSAGGRYDVEYLTAVGLAEATPGDEYEFSLDTPSRLHALKRNGLLDDEELEVIVRALSLFAETEYLLELQEFTLPRSAERATALELYLSRSFDYWGVPRGEGVVTALTDAKRSVRMIFDRLMMARAE
jgi:glutamate-ammonia-ligase adenylyltransferase